MDPLGAASEGTPVGGSPVPLAPDTSDATVAGDPPPAPGTAEKKSSPPDPSTADEPDPADKPGSDAAAEKVPVSRPDSDGAAWKPLFDGKSLDGWKSTEFGGEGEIFVEDGSIIMESGHPLTGITFTGDFPKLDYEVQLEAMKVDGIDFFCGLTFPVAESHCSFIVGGWSGSVIGISSIDGQDASENETTRIMKLDKGKWYAIRVRVTADKLEAWIDDQQLVDQVITGRRITTRNEVNPSKPMGISAYETKSALRGIQVRSLKAE